MSSSLNSSSVTIKKHDNLSTKKGVKFFRPWIAKCCCIDCNMTIDSQKLIDILKKAIDEEIEERLSHTMNESREDCSDRMSTNSSASTIIIDNLD